MGSSPPLQKSHVLALENSKRTHVEGSRGVRQGRRKLEDHENVDQGDDLNHVNRHVRRMAVENDDVWLSVNLAVVDKLRVVELVENIE